MIRNTPPIAVSDEGDVTAVERRTVQPISPFIRRGGAAVNRIPLQLHVPREVREGRVLPGLSDSQKVGEEATAVSYLLIEKRDMQRLPLRGSREGLAKLI
jgi:hypothetical protein